jgi:hypothetical protein
LGRRQSFGYRQRPGKAADFCNAMCRRIIQSSKPLRLAIIEGLDVSDSRLANVRPRYNAAPSEELLVIRQNRVKRLAQPTKLTRQKKNPPKSLSGGQKHIDET